VNNMEKHQQLIILDSANGRVAVIATVPEHAARLLHRGSKGDLDEIVEEWCEQNNTRSSDCQWMVWDGVIKIEP